jgi:hypothetical protein
MWCLVSSSSFVPAVGWAVAVTVQQSDPAGTSCAGKNVKWENERMWIEDDGT